MAMVSAMGKEKRPTLTKSKAQTKAKLQTKAEAKGVSRKPQMSCNPHVADFTLRAEARRAAHQEREDWFAAFFGRAPRNYVHCGPYPMGIEEPLAETEPTSYIIDFSHKFQPRTHECDWNRERDWNHERDWSRAPSDDSATDADDNWETWPDEAS